VHLSAVNPHVAALAEATAANARLLGNQSIALFPRQSSSSQLLK
jgi:hypothetical protein